MDNVMCIRNEMICVWQFLHKCGLTSRLSARPTCTLCMLRVYEIYSIVVNCFPKMKGQNVCMGESYFMINSI